jgi:brefeldin A-inhibited guanine nucleotide-exchange protein
MKDPPKNKDGFTFIDAMREFLMLCLSRNATSIIIPIFEATVKLFGELFVECRTFLKKELEIFFTEIVLNILEANKEIPWNQQHSMLKELTRIFSQDDIGGGKLLVEIYLNYDCNIKVSEKGNIWERLVNSIAKITSHHVDANNSIVYEPIPSYIKEDPFDKVITAANLVNLSKDQVATLMSSKGNAPELRKQGARLLALGILIPLSEWCHKKEPENPKTKDKDSGDDLNAILNQVEEANVVTSPSNIDDPKSILKQKQKKTHMTEGIQIFNTDAKKVFNSKSGNQIFTR